MDGVVCDEELTWLDEVLSGIGRGEEYGLLGTERLDDTDTDEDGTTEELNTGVDTGDATGVLLITIEVEPTAGTLIEHYQNGLRCLR